MRVNPARSTTLTQEFADQLFNIACVAKALVKEPLHKDSAKIRDCLAKMIAKADAHIPEAGFSWRIPH